MLSILILVDSTADEFAASGFFAALSWINLATTSSDMAATQNSGAGVLNWTDPSVALAFNESTLPVSGAEGTIKKPFSRPVVSAKAESRPSLTAEQQEKYQKVLETVRAWRDIPVSSAKHAAAEPLTEGERMFLTRDCLLRYLRATKWVVPDAITRIRATLVWRREYGVEKLTPDYISVENETGKQLILGYDINGRPCLILNPSLQNTERSHRQMEHLVFMIERMIDIMPPYEESLTIMVNFKNTKASQNASIKQGKETISIVQNHYPERLGRALVINCKWLCLPLSTFDF